MGFPSGPVVRTSPSNAEGRGSIPAQGTEIPYALWPKNQNIRQNQYCLKGVMPRSIKVLFWTVFCQKF